ncbi:hypothetical protein F4818DRAFT_73128 [Hypoxylon cercidicola]|nr:hypothetical protein F4818DRAFT_73128 [Hypoxylon cercidicola]
MAIMSEHQKDEKKDISHEDSLEYKSAEEQLDSTSDGLPSYKEVNTEDQQPPPCSHWSESGCCLAVESRQCCACLDERPETESGQYTMYVDGVGWVEEAPRWQYYCPNCQQYFDPDAKAKFIRAQRAWAEKRAEFLAAERDRKYLGFGRYIQAVMDHFSR